MRFDYQQKSVIVTGGGVGIGYAAALAFARSNARVVVNSISESGAETVRQILEQGGSAIFVQGDVSDEVSAKKIVDAAVEQYGRLDILINNAGIVVPGKLEELSQEQFDRSYEVNVRGVFLMSKYAIEHMIRQRGGSIVNNASVAAIKAVRNRIAYAASKGAVVAMSRCMALDLAEYNIRVNCVAPGMTLTPSLAERIASTQDPAATETYFKSLIPLNRFAQTEEIANAILFAASEEASFMTGSIISIDGGKSS